MIKTKSVYEPSDPGDGFRLLVMRKWPRRIRKDDIDAWEKYLAPSEEILKDWMQRKISFYEFKTRYLRETKDKE